MTVDDDQLTELLTDRASDVRADPSLLATVRVRARRRRRARRAAATAVAAAAVAASVAIVAPAGHTTGQATVLPGNGTPAAPSFPLTPTDLPAGLGPARTLMTAGHTVLRYGPAGATEAAAMITVEVGETTPADVDSSRSSVPATVDGRPAQVLPGPVPAGGQGLSTTVLFTRQPDQVVAVSGTGPYGSAPLLIALAGSLTDTPIAATLPYTVTDVPAEVGPLEAYDGATMSFGTDPAAPTLSITFSPVIGVTPTGTSVVDPSPTGSPSVAQVVDSRSDGMFRLTSSVLSTDQLRQLATHVATSSVAETVAPTVTTSTAPIDVAPAPLPTTLPSPGPQPTDARVATDAVRAAFHTAFTAEPPGQPYFSLAGVVGGDALHGALDQLRANYPEAVDTVSVTTGTVVFATPTSADVEFTLNYSGGAPYGTQIGKAVLTKGHWLVARDTYCDVLAFGGATCPAG